MIAIGVLLIVAILAVVTLLAVYYTLPTSTNLTCRSQTGEKRNSDISNGSKRRGESGRNAER